MRDKVSCVPPSAKTGQIGTVKLPRGRREVPEIASKGILWRRAAIFPSALLMVRILHSTTGFSFASLRV